MKIFNIFQFANLHQIAEGFRTWGKRRGGWRDSGSELCIAKQKREFEKQLVSQGYCRSLAKIMVAERFVQSKPN